MAEPNRREILQAQLRARESRWERFREWELAELARTDCDFRTALAWMSDAWDLARKADPTWSSAEGWEDHVKHLREVRACLSVLGRG